MWAALIAIAVLAAASTPAEVALERGRAALEAGDLAVAREQALVALADDVPGARALHAEVLVAAGMGLRGLTEIAELPGAAPAPWDSAHEGLRAAMGTADTKTAVAHARALADGWPDHPELLLPLWEVAEPAGSIRRLRSGAARKVAAAIPESTDPAWLYRARAVQLAAGADLVPVADALVSAGEPRPPTARPVDRIARSEVARLLSNAEVFAVPELRPRDAADVIDRAGELALAEHRVPRALEAWEALQGPDDTVAAATGRARALLALKRYEDAITASDVALGLAVAPWPDDLAGTDATRRAVALVAVLDVQAQALEGANHRIAAMSDDGIAAMISGRSGATPLADRIRTAAAAEALTVQDRYPSPGAERALREAENALAGGRDEEALRHANAALFLFSWVRGLDWRLEGAAAHAVQARALTHLGETDAARIAWEIALLLRPEAPADWWSDAGDAAERAGALDAAYARFATAVARGGDPAALEPALARTHRGPGDPLRVAPSAAVPAPEHPEEAKVGRVIRGVEYRFATPAPRRPASAAAVAPPPAVGQPMPAWSAQTDTGTLSSAALTGRAWVLVLWASDCHTCLVAIHETGAVARDLRKAGHDVAVVAVSLDEEDRFFDAVRELETFRVTLARNPELGPRLGAIGIPELWIVDHRGYVRYHETLWRGGRVIERALRQSLTE